jgi:hypothetical protein
VNANAERGSTLVLALVVMVLVTGVGLSLLMLTGGEVEMSRADLQAKQAFFFAEAGVEEARMALLASNGKGVFDDELASAYGADGLLSFDPFTLRPVYDAEGNLTAFAGYGDDALVTPVTAQGVAGLEGWYAAFLTNDPGEIDVTNDSNDRVMLHGVGVGPRGAMEIVQAIVERETLFPTPPAAITMLGPDPDFWGGESSAKEFQGDDCVDPLLDVPVVGVIGAAAETQAQTGVDQPDTFTSGSDTGIDTVADIDGIVDPRWNDCQYWLDLAVRVRGAADVIGDASTPSIDLGTLPSPRVVFVEDDFTLLDDGVVHAGLLWVTGDLILSGSASWYGTIFAVGKGSVVRNGGGNGTTDGAVIVVDVAGPDGVLFTSDDCSGPDGLPGTGDDGIAEGLYQHNGGGDHETSYCSAAIDLSLPALPYRITDFRQL